jgi:hypothetical protein
MSCKIEFRETKMIQMAFEACEIVNIQIVRERRMFNNRNCVSAPEQTIEAFCALLGNPDRERSVRYLVNLIMTADVYRNNLMALDYQLHGDPVTDVDCN